MDVHTIIQSSFFTGAISGLMSAVAVDYSAFRKWQTIDQAATYDWEVALWRWFQGFVGGGLGATVFRGLTA